MLCAVGQGHANQWPGIPVLNQNGINLQGNIDMFFTNYWGVMYKDFPNLFPIFGMTGASNANHPSIVQAQAQLVTEIISKYKESDGFIFP